MLSRTQKLHFIKTVVVTKASCTFPLGYMCPTDLAKLDSMYSRICKRSVGTPSSSPTALVCALQRNWGWHAFLASGVHTVHYRSSCVPSPVRQCKGCQNKFISFLCTEYGPSQCLLHVFCLIFWVSLRRSLPFVTVGIMGCPKQPVL